MDDLQSSALFENGFTIAAPILSAAECERWIASLCTLDSTTTSPRRGGERNLFQRINETRQLARHPAIRKSVEAVLGADCFAVRALYFDKTETTNWSVPWHQDVTIAVRQQRDTPGYGPWSIKCDIQHVQPPPAVLERMLAVRIHLDACPEENGPLRVLPGSHHFGIFPPGTIGDSVPRFTPQCCPVPRGGLLFMRPLLLHASGSATQPGHRRVIHLEYAAGKLAAGLEWFERW